MAMQNPKGRANYEPNSWAQGGPRADPKRGHVSFPEELSGEKRKIRPESFADHYSQARQFYISQTPIEQQHIADALVFELSKVHTPEIRARMVAHLPNIDAGLAQKVADGLGLKSVPKAHVPAKAVVETMPSDALSILKKAPGAFKGRKMGILMTDSIDAGLLKAVMQEVMAAGGVVELIAPKVGGVVAADGTEIPAQQKINGAPSVVYDAVVVLASAEGAAELAALHPARCFAADAFAHAKFIGLGGAAGRLFEAAGVTMRDAGMMELATPGEAKAFVTACADLRFWERVAV